MPLHSQLRDRVERRLREYCEDHIPERVRHQLRLSYKIRANHVTLLEGRPAIMDSAKWVDIVVAQFRFRPKDSMWRLYWADRNSRWHEYVEAGPTYDLEELLREVDEDPTGIFWG